MAHDKYSRRDVRFHAEGIELSGWLYQPQGHSKTACIVMAAGYAAVKEMVLDRFASHFAEAGFSVLLYDHRNFGSSGGEPRQEINPWDQIEGYRHAISYAASLESVDSNRIGIWGSSYSGGHVLVVAATDRRVKAVVAQVPTISGHLSSQRRVPADKVQELYDSFAEDRQQRLKGDGPSRKAVVPEQLGSAAIYSSKDARDFYLNPEFAPYFKNEVTLRSVEWSRAYEPGVYIARISPTPLLLLVASHDHTTPTDLALTAYEQALEPKKLVLLKGGHFDVYGSQIERSRQEALTWFQEWLV